MFSPLHIDSNPRPQGRISQNLISFGFWKLLLVINTLHHLAVCILLPYFLGFECIRSGRVYIMNRINQLEIFMLAILSNALLLPRNGSVAGLWGTFRTVSHGPWALKPCANLQLPFRGPVATTRVASHAPVSYRLPGVGLGMACIKHSCHHVSEKTSLHSSNHDS